MLNVAYYCKSCRTTRRAAWDYVPTVYRCPQCRQTMSNPGLDEYNWLHKGGLQSDLEYRESQATTDQELKYLRWRSKYLSKIRY
jgi:hypothetical protein